MSVNLFDTFKDAVGGTLVNKASSMLGESEGVTSSALGAILPTLMGSMVNKGATESGAQGVLDFLKGGNFDGSILNNVGDLLGGGDKTSGLLSSGAGILKYLVGDKLGSLVDLVSGSSGMKVGSANTMMKMVGPLLMGVVGKFVKEKALDALGLKNLFASQASEVQKRMPAGIGDLLGLGGLGKLGAMATNALGGARDSVSSATSSASSAATAAIATGSGAATAAAHKASDTAKAAGGGLGKILPWIALALGALAILYWISRGDGKDALKDAKEATTEVAKDVGNAAKKGANAVADAAKDAGNAAADAMRSINLPGGKKIDVRKGSFEAKVVNRLTNKGANLDKAITFDNLNFATGSANIDPKSEVQLQALADILGAYKTSKIRVEGHTDNTGDAAKNMTLSNQRARAVKNWLSQHGVASARMETVGRGQKKPIADNGTQDGRDKNKRVEVYITAR